MRVSVAARSDALILLHNRTIAQGYTLTADAEAIMCEAMEAFPEVSRGGGVTSLPPLSP